MGGEGQRAEKEENSETEEKINGREERDHGMGGEGLRKENELRMTRKGQWEEKEGQGVDLLNGGPGFRNIETRELEPWTILYLLVYTECIQCS